MRFALALALLTATLGLASPAPDAPIPQEVAVPMEARDVDDALAATPLSKRACSKTGCKCIKGLSQGTYCGACMLSGKYVITAKRHLKHIYECSPSGDCCDYGTASDCNTGHGRCG